MEMSEISVIVPVLDEATQLEIGWKLNSTLIDKLSKKLGIADLGEYMGDKELKNNF